MLNDLRPRSRFERAPPGNLHTAATSHAVHPSLVHWETDCGIACPLLPSCRRHGIQLKLPRDSDIPTEIKVLCSCVDQSALRFLACRRDEQLTLPGSQCQHKARRSLQLSRNAQDPRSSPPSPLYDMSTTAGALDAFAPPPGLNYVAAIGPSLTFLLISTICTSMLVPITVVLFLFSTPALRRRPIFIFNVLSLAGGFGMGILGAYGQVRTSPRNT